MTRLLDQQEEGGRVGVGVLQHHYDFIVLDDVADVFEVRFDVCHERPWFLLFQHIKDQMRNNIPIFGITIFIIFIIFINIIIVVVVLVVPISDFIGLTRDEFK